MLKQMDLPQAAQRDTIDRPKEAAREQVTHRGRGWISSGRRRIGPRKNSDHGIRRCQPNRKEQLVNGLAASAGR